MQLDQVMALLYTLSPFNNFELCGRSQVIQRVKASRAAGRAARKCALLGSIVDIRVVGIGGLQSGQWPRLLATAGFGPNRHKCEVGAATVVPLPCLHILLLYSDSHLQITICNPLSHTIALRIL